MDRRSINIHIFGRQFPVRVTEEEATVIKAAAHGINSKIRTFRADYTHQDDIDIALMTCLDIMTEFLQYKADHEQEATEALHALESLDQEMDKALNTDS